MKKIWIALMMATSLAFVGCEKTPEEKNPEVIPDPILFVTVPSTVKSGDTFIVQVEAVNAVSTENNIGAPTDSTTWSYQIVAKNENLNITISAINKAGKIVTFNKIVTVIPIYVPTALDTICSVVWETKSNSFRFDNDTIWIFENIPIEHQMHVMFRKDMKYKGYLYPYKSTDYLGEWDWSINLEKKQINFSGLKDYVLTNKKLTLYFPGIFVDKDGKRFSIIRREIYVSL